MSIQIKTAMQPFRFARNGTYPDASFQGEIATTFNHLARFRLKEVARFGMTMPGVRGSPATGDPEPRWRCRYTASPYVRGIVFYGYLALTELENTSQDPYGLITVAPDSTAPIGAKTGTGELHYGEAATEASDPDSCSALFDTLRDEDGNIFEPLAGQAYDVEIADVQSRLVACSVFEVHQYAGPIVSENYAAGTPILDTDRSVILEGARDMWHTQGAPLFAWTVDDQAVPRTSTSGTAKNIIDDTSTAVSAATVGYTLDLRNRARVSTGTVSCRMSVYASSTDEGHVFLKDSTGADVGDVTVTGGSAAWHEVDFEMLATLAKYDLHYASATAETLTVYAVQCRQISD